MTTDFMIDIETLDTEPTSIILSLASIAFKRRSPPGEYVGAMIQALNIEQPNRTFSHSTIVDFHLQLPSGVNQYMTTEPVATLNNALAMLRGFMVNNDLEPDSRVWANGACFDMGILDHAYKTADTNCPWDFFQIRDCRTVFDFNDCKDIRDKYKNLELDLHNPLTDCRWQTNAIQEIELELDDA